MLIVLGVLIGFCFVDYRLAIWCLCLPIIALLLPFLAIGARLIH